MITTKYQAMRIIAVGPLPPQKGGGHISRARIFRSLARRGHYVTVIAPITKDDLKKGDWFAAQNPTINIIRYPLHEFEFSTLVQPSKEFIQNQQNQIEKLLTQAIFDLRPDLIIIGREGFCRYITPLAKYFNLPCVLLARGNPTNYILDGKWPEEDVQTYIEEFRKVSQILTVADYMTRGLMEFSIPHVKTIPNAIDNQTFRPKQGSLILRRELGIEDSSMIVLMPGVLTTRKRPIDYIKAASLVTKLNQEVHFILAGDGPLRDQVELLLEHCDFGNRFHLLDWISHDQMPEYYNLADVVVMPSEAEGMSRVYLEAMACGCTLIASDIAPASDLIRNGITGLLYPLGDIETLASTILKILSHPEQLRQMGLMAHIFMQDFSEEKLFDLYEQAFHRVIHEHII